LQGMYQPDSRVSQPNYIGSEDVGWCGGAHETLNHFQVLTKHLA
jgi:hypothetical protein